MTKNKKSVSIAFSFILASVLGLLTTSAVLAATAKLNWTAPNQNADGTPLTDLGGYKVYWGTTSRGTAVNPPANYTGSQSVGNVTEYSVNNISDRGATYFSVTATDTSNNESGFSNEVWKVPGDVDKNGTVNIFDYNILKSNINQTNCDNAADIDLNCVVNIFDYNALKTNVGFTISS